MLNYERASRPFSGRAFNFGVAAYCGLLLPVTMCPHTRVEPPSVPDDTVELSIATDKTEYAPGEAIEITLTVTNRTDQSVTLQFMSGQRYDLSVLTAENREVWRWGLTRGFVQMIGSETLDPGGRKVYTEQYAGDLSAGTYSLVGVITSRNYPLEARTNFSVR